jgi:hypothetical protein
MMKKSKTTTLYSYRVEVSDDNGPQFLTVQSHSRSGAVYAAYRASGLSEFIDFKDFILPGGIRVKKLGEIKKEHFYPKSDLAMGLFNHVIQMRGIAEYCKLGTKVLIMHGGKFTPGFVVDANSGSNLVVWVPEINKTFHCHPFWKIKYLDDKDQIVKEYME